MAKAVKSKETNGAQSVVIQPPNFQYASLLIRGTAPYVQHRFSEKARNTMIENQMAGQQSRKGKVRKPKDFDALYEAAMHKSRDGWHGIPAAAFRNAAISGCRTVGFKMTIAKLSLFIDADGFDPRDSTPLVKITKGAPRQYHSAARNANGGTDIRCRPMWEPGWEAKVRVRWDADQFSATDVVNLFARVGLQVGIGEGRADSRESAGVGWGFFEVVS